MQKIKVSFIGAGYMSAEHMKAFEAIEDVEIAGIFSRTKAKAQLLASLYPGAITADSIEDLYLKTKADIVVVSVSEMEVAKVAFQCFRYPWICLFEKPLGINFEEARQISAEAEKSKSQVFVLLNRRQYSSTATVMQDLRDLEGKRLITVQDQEDIMIQIKNGLHKKLTDNWMYANAIHIIDYFSFLGRGEIEKVENIIPWNPEKPDYVMAKLTYTSGDIGLYTAVWNAPSPWSVSVVTSHRRWELKPLEQAARQDYGSRTLVPVASGKWDSDFKPGLRKQAQEAVNAMKGIPHNLPGIEEALKTMELVNRIYGI